MKIRQVRSELRMSQAEFARLLGVHQTAVSQWETGRTSPDLDALQRIAHYSGRSVDELLAPVNPDTLEIRMTDGGMRGARIEEGDTVCLRTGNFRQKHDSHGIGYGRREQNKRKGHPHKNTINT